MNKYIIEYSTGGEADSRYHQEPTYYEGSKEELVNEFHYAYKGILLGDRLAVTLRKLKLISNFHKTGWQHSNIMFKAGSRTFNMYDFLYDGKIYPPNVTTLDEWFEEESEINDE